MRPPTRAHLRTYGGVFPPVTELEWRVTGGTECIEFDGPDRDGDLTISINEDSRYFPVEYLANHLRVQGWTVTPPEGEDPTE